jgi:hypothetical protein
MPKDMLKICHDCFQYFDRVGYLIIQFILEIKNYIKLMMKNSYFLIHIIMSTIILQIFK